MIDGKLARDLPSKLQSRDCESCQRPDLLQMLRLFCIIGLDRLLLESLFEDLDVPVLFSIRSACRVSPLLAFA